MNYIFFGNGFDNDLFAIDSSGRVRFKNPPNYENPLDGFGSSRNNIYFIRIAALDADGNNLGDITHRIEVLNANDVGSLSAISGSVREGNELTVGTLTDEDGTNDIRYQWFADDSAIDGATNNTYTLKTEDIGKVITVQVTYNDSFANNIQLTSIPTGVVSSVSQNAAFNDISSVSYQESLSSVVLTALAVDPDSSDTVVNYSITGIDSSLFTIASNGELTFDSVPNFEMPLDTGGNNIYNLEINALDSSNDILGIQSVIVAVLNVNDIGSLSAISGLVREGEILTAGDIFDEDGSVDNERYQWLSDGTEIASATNSTYTLQSSDVGTEISVRVTYDDGFGTDHQLTSAETTTLVSSVTPNATFDSSASATYMENLESVVLTVRQPTLTLQIW